MSGPVGSGRDRGGPPVTPDGRYLVVRGRLWRCSDPALDPAERERLTSELMAARRAKGAALRAGDDEARERARARVDAAKRALGERGPVWWDDGTPDLTRHLARTTAYAAWWAEQEGQEDGAVDTLDLTGAVVLVTGASSGIGEATARVLHEAGAHPVLAARRADRLQALGEELGGALAVPTDVTDARGVAHLVQAALERHGRIDGLVNNAGVSLHEPLATVDLDELRRVLDLNVTSVVAMTQAVLPAMRAQGRGRIVNISSGTTRMVLPGVGAYAATKAAVNMLSAVARKELEGEGIAVSLVLPSITATEFGGGRYQSGRPAGPGMVPHSAEHVGRVVVRALRTGEERLDIPPGPEQEQLTRVPAPA